jgi:hypothetical protein
MFYCALSAVALHRPLSSTPPLSAVSPLLSAVVVVRHRYCPHRPPPSTAVRRRRCHCRPPLSMPLSTTVVDSAHHLHCPSSAVLIYVCSLPSPSTVLRLSHTLTSLSADGNDDDAGFGCHRQRWVAARAVAMLAVSWNRGYTTPPCCPPSPPSSSPGPLSANPMACARAERGDRACWGRQRQWGAQTTDNNQLKAAAEESALSPLHGDSGDNIGDNDDNGSGDDSGGTKSGSGRIGAVTVA